MTPPADTMKLEHVAERAAGYGMPGVRVDGNDPLAVKSALDEALRRAPGGGGPPLLQGGALPLPGPYFRGRVPYIPQKPTAAGSWAAPRPALPPPPPPGRAPQ